MKNDFKLDFSRHLSQFSSKPYFFIGSGFSRRYYSLPTWVDLLESFFNSHDFGVDFNFYKSMSGNDLPDLATRIAKEFHSKWWNESRYAVSRTINRTLAGQNTEVPFKIELAELIKRNCQVDKDQAEELELIKRSRVDGIITTNWDDLTEQLFPDFHVFIGQQELLFSESISLGEIYKIHGSVSEPASLIVTGDDYRKFENSNPYLAAKLLTLFVEQPIIFIGYSLSDPHIIRLVDAIIKCVDQKNLDRFQGRLIFIEWDPLRKDAEMSNAVLRLSSSIIPILLVKANSFVSIYGVLSELDQKIPLKVLKKLKDSVYEFIHTNTPTNKLLIRDIDSKDADDIEFVVGIGEAQRALAEQGYVGILASDIYEDLLFSDRKLNAKLLVNETMPRIATGNSFIPMCKYIQAIDGYNKDGSLNHVGKNAIAGTNYRHNMPRCFLPPIQYENKRDIIKANFNSVEKVIKEYSADKAVLFIQYIDHENIDLKDLLSFLQMCYKDESLFEHSNFRTHFRKLTCLYDFLKYGRKR